MANTDAKWNEQAFLIDFYKQWLHLNNNKVYNNFVQITGDPTGLVNKIYSEGSINDFSKITTAQASMLVPHIEIFKVVYPEKNKESGKIMFGDSFMEIKLPFSNNTKAGEFKTGDILASRLARGSSVGLKTVDWEDLGTTPADSGFSFKVTMSLFFQSIDALFKEWSSSGILDGKKKIVKTAWADLVSPPGPIDKPNKALEEVDGDTSRIPYHDKNYTIKLVAGWSVPQDPGKAVFSPSDKKVIEAIKRQKNSYILSLISHSININADGTVDLDLEYIARIEGRMLNSANADLLYIEDGSPAVKVVDVINKSIEQIKKDKIEAQKAADKASKALDKELEAKLKNSNGRQGVEATDVFATQAISDKLANELKVLNTRQEVQEGLIQKAKYDQKAQSYRRIIKQIEESSRIYQIAVTPEMVEAWEASLDRATDLKSLEERNKKILANKEKSASAITQGLERQHVNAGEASPDTMELNRDFLESAVLDPDAAMPKRLEAMDKYFNAVKNAENPRDGETYVSFFFFGDLIEAAINVVLEGREGRYNLLGDGNKRKIDKSDFDFILGPIEMYEYLSGNKVEITSVPLCDLPISTKVFDMWFVKNIIKPMRESLTLKQFFRMVASELITGVLSPPVYGPIGSKQKSKMSFNTFSLPIGENNPFRPTSDNRNRLDINNLKYPDFYNVFRKGSKTKDYFLMYFAGSVSNRLTGKEEDDSKIGIPWFKIAQDRGIVKNINFTKTDIPGHRDAMIAKNEEAAKRNQLYSNLYKANVTTLGCPVFKPGMLTSIDPRGFGLGKHSKYANLGFGGYYTIIKVSNTISDGTYQTSLDMMYESPSPPKKPDDYTIEYKTTEDIKEINSPSLGQNDRHVQAIIAKIVGTDVETSADVPLGVLANKPKPVKKSKTSEGLISKEPMDNL